MRQAINNREGTTEMTIGMIRQGDVLLVPAERVPPTGCKPAAEVILAEGEVTGHAHRLGGAAVLDWIEKGHRYVQVLGDRPGTLRHEDHDPVAAPVVPAGQTFEVIPQREWSLEGQWKKVVD